MPAKATTFDAWLGLIPYRPGFPTPGKITLPKNVEEALPKPLRDFFRPIGTDTEQDQKDDNKRVLKLADAIQVIQDTMTDSQFLLYVAAWAGGQFHPTGGDNPLQAKIARELRAKVLRQDSPRQSVTYTYSKREI